MDKEQARFFLAGYRPDGADAQDPDFADALSLAAGDRELGEWLAEERAFDADFAASLAAVPIPARLRAEILGGLAAGRGDFPECGPEDAAMIGALAAVHPPDGLRSRVLAAMNATQTGAVSPPARSLWQRAAWPVSAAAGIALAFFLTRGNSLPTAPAAVSLPRVEARFVHAVNARNFPMEHRAGDPPSAIADLKSRGLPCPCCLPAGLADAKVAGCRELEIEGKHGSVLCFALADGSLVHLLSFRRQDISCQLPSYGKPKIGRKDQWSVAKWATDDKVYMLIGEQKIEQLAALF